MRKSPCMWMRYRKRNPNHCDASRDLKFLRTRKEKQPTTDNCPVLCRKKLPRSSLLWEFGIDNLEIFSCDPATTRRESRYLSLSSSSCRRKQSDDQPLLLDVSGAGHL
ncbi:hypothetical protein BV898_12651 [Hypsibius exemplaris]|uniref:Uncharacterized protein n=1 Tax=Hypsibius exemplaris TaxID=2072580 RepID=A0A1W0WD32_HYPEX|nr:hypothetical protein BV898_12651 [Hypsibius exemplaris]